MATTDPPGADASPAVRNARLFDSLADTYDAVGVEFFGPIAQGLLGLLDPQPGESFLDVGCGKGALLLPAARAVGRSGRAVGIDVAPAMVSAARTAADAAGRGFVEVVVGDAQSPELPAGAFDVVGSSLVLFFLPDPLGCGDRLAPRDRAGRAPRRQHVRAPRRRLACGRRCLHAVPAAADARCACQWHTRPVRLGRGRG